ncbi:MAG: hypothetical protein ACI90V_004261 [Bacillariaceae sp.]|jgi:hypothetical protein
MYWHIVPMMMFVTSLILPHNNINNIEKSNKENNNEHDNKGAASPASSKISNCKGKWFGIGRRQFYQQSVVVVGAAVLYPTTPGSAVATVTLADERPQDIISPSSPQKNSISSPISSSKKPSAPISALLPAIRAKIWIENSYKILGDTTRDVDKTLEDLNYVLTHRPKLFVSRGEEPLSRVSSSIFAQFTAKNSNDNNNINININPLSSSPGARISKALNRADEARQWGMLQSQESKNERENELRAAFNFYTQQLEFDSNSYAWTGTAEERKRRIRDDRIPTPQSVIVSDLDLRDLYRNQLLTALDDVTAEVNYQFRQLQRQKESNPVDNTGGEKIVVDLTDTVDLMNQVYVVCTKWFDMIDISDVEKAEDVVRNEQQSESSIITSK